MLMHHMDVVPATAGEWSVPPFAGTFATATSGAAAASTTRAAA